MFKEDIKNLYDLQRIDSRLQYIEKSKGGLPETVNQIQADLDERGSRYDSLVEENEHLAKEKVDLQSKIAASNSDIERYQDQRKQVTTNKEYEALMSQISFAEEQVEDSEVRIQEIELIMNGNQDEISQINEGKKEVEESLAENKKLLEQKLSETVQEEEQLNMRKKQLIEALPKRTYALYEKIRRSKKGVAVVSGEKGYCEGCHTMLPWQKISELKRQNQIVQCEACSRILTYHVAEEVVDKE